MALPKDGTAAAEQVAALVAQGRLIAAAELAADHGLAARAAELFEQACEFGRAAQQALLSEDRAKAMRLAVLTGDEELLAAVTTELLSTGDESLIRRVAADLCARHHHRHGARLYRGIAAHSEAAEAFERAGEALAAADCYERGGQPAAAARILEAALRAAELHLDQDEVRVTLGNLYSRHRKHEPAVRVLQQVGRISPWRPRGLRALLVSLEALGLDQAIRDLRPELEQHGLTPGAGGDDEAAEPQVGAADGVLLYGRYQVVAEVMTTPHARVVEAVDRLTCERVAVKLFAARSHGSGRDALQRFVREARALTQLRHPNVVPLRDFVAEGPAMVLAWMPGGTLRELLDLGPMSPARAHEIARAVLGALVEAHRLGILHRDIKPSNLLFDDAGTAKLADFGAAHLAESAATVTAGAIGTVAYMSPEQRLGRPATVRSDVYSVGVLLCEMLTGRLPSPDAPDVRVSHAHPDLDEAHDELVGRFLHPDPDRRFDGAQQAREAADALSWPVRIVQWPHRAELPEGGQPAQPTEVRGERLVTTRVRGHAADAARRRHDSWLGREVLVLPWADDESLAVASCFARAGHPALPLVLRADREAGEIWIAPPKGCSLAEQSGTLTDAEHERLLAALSSLAEVGGVHGSIDSDHVYRHCGTVFLAYPRKRPSAQASQVGDRIALRRLHGE